MMCDLILKMLAISEMAFFWRILHNLFFLGGSCDGVDTSFEAVL